LEVLPPRALVEYGDLLAVFLPERLKRLDLAEKCYRKAIELVERFKHNNVSKAYHRIGIYYINYCKKQPKVSYD